MGKISFLSRLEKKREKDLVYSMVRLLAQREGQYLRELLYLISEDFGAGCVLSIVEAENREVITTTEELSNLSQLQNTVYSLKDIEEKGHYLLEAKHGFLFRAPFICIRVYPLQTMGLSSFFLLAEQTIDRKPNIGRCLELFEVALQMMLYERYSEKNITPDIIGREKLLDKLRNVDLMGINLGVFHVKNYPALQETFGASGAASYIRELEKLTHKAFHGDSYLLSRDKIAVLGSDSVFQVSTKMQDCMDECRCVTPKVEVGAIVCPVCGDIYRALYLCESNCMDVAQDMVVTIKNPMESLNVGGEILAYGCTGQDGREVYGDSMVDSATDANESKYSESEEMGFAFEWEGGFEKMESTDGL